MTPATSVLSPVLSRADGGVALLDRLRTATAQQHSELEATVAINRRLAHRDEYRWLLEKFYGFYHALERKLERSPAAERDDLAFSEREKARWLAQDLAQLGIADVSRLPQACDLPAVDNYAAALGTMYVLEGSTLGGRHIAALLKASAIPPNAQRFFHSYGAEVGTMWRSFCGVLNELSAPHEQDVAVANARATFASMRAWLEERR